jgi:23S rRNA (guanosine2251-2'-O)-methyltransferase
MYLYNKKLIREFIEDKNNLKKINKIYISKSIQNNPLIKKIIYILKQNEVPINILDPEIFNKKFSFLDHQSIVLEYSDFLYSNLEEIEKNINKVKLPIIILGYKIKDPRNLGALMRVCYAFDIAGILIPNKDSVNVNDTVIQASRNSKIKIHRFQSITKIINHFISKKYNIILLDKSGENKLHKLDYNFILPKSLVIIGGEIGVNKEIIKNIINLKTVSIEIYNIESLNLTNAASIFLYHFFSKKKQFNLNY